MLSTPILFLIFNRPETTERVFKEIRKQKPKYLFVAADGPRVDKPDDAEKCRKSRELVMNGIDWDCEFKTLFREKNLGCGLAVCSAITWFFENVEEGIILEDDCLPGSSFFTFCEYCLIRYKFKNEIMHINGNNFQKRIWGDATYFYSTYSTIWGWATWKRAWSKYQYDISDISKIELENIISRRFSFGYKDDWIKHFVEFSQNQNNNIPKWDTWDYQWFLCLMKNNGLSVYPNFNLVKNIGFGPDATHTTVDNNAVSNKFCEKIEGNIISPQKIVTNKKADNYTSKVIFGFEKNRLKKKMKLLIKKIIAQILKVLPKK